MEYIPSITLGEFARQASYSEWQKSVESLTDLLAATFKSSTVTGTSLFEHDSFVSKLKSMHQNPGLGESQRKMLNRALEMTFNYAQDTPLRLGPNHGDLSYENILVHQRSKAIYLVDFLPSPFESPVIDAGRLLIDAEHGWWFSGATQTSTEVSSGMYLAKRVRSSLGKLGVGTREIDVFKCLGALRILPYTVNPVRRAKLLSVLNSIIDP